MLISILTGLAAGAVHVIAGPDHLLAIAPTAFQTPRRALRNGIAWGLGHSAGIMSLCLIAILLKDLTHIETMSSFAELAVGIILLYLGFLAIKTSLRLKIHAHQHKHALDESHKHLHLHFGSNQKHNQHSHAFTSLGVLHGFAGGTHLLAVIPALAMPPMDSFLYMSSYLFGSIITMSIVVFTMSLATLKAGRKILPMTMRLTGCLSVITGFFWIHKTSNILL